MNIASVIQVAALFAWVGFFALLVLMISRSSRKQPARGLGSAVIAVVVVALLLTTLGAGLVFIEPFETGVVVSVLADGGLRPDPLDAGLHWVIPFVERVEEYPTSRQTFTMARTAAEGEIRGELTVEARTSDGQRIFVDSSVIYEIDPTKVIALHQTWQHRYVEELIHPQTRGTIRDAVSQYRVEEVLSSKRFEMAAEITEALRQVLADNGLVLVDFVLRDITFTEEYAQSIEQKQIAEQQAFQAQFVIEQRKAEAQQAREVAQGQADAAVIAAQGAAEARTIEAQAEAQANILLAQSLTSQLIQYEYIIRLSPSVQTIFIPSDEQFILPLPGTALP
jgi:regulator of protease activity HflC (stomatin/prohibitin superfamily)